jgi:hypothetical protein
MTTSAGSQAMACFIMQVACAEGVRAMPSARALLVASLLTEPPFGCLGPSGNDRYRKRSETVELRKSTAKLRRLFRNESTTTRRVPAGAIGGSTAMIRTACWRKSPRVPGVWWLGRWALGTSERGGQDKNRKVRTVGLVRNNAKFSTCGTHCERLQQCAFSDNVLSSLCFQHLTGSS